MSFWPTWRENPLFTSMVFLVSLALFIFLGGKAYSTFLTVARLDQPTPTEHSIYIEGVGKATVIPNIAVMTFGISTKEKTVADAQKQNTTAMNAMIDKIKAAGISEDDLQTKDYNAYENTEFNPQTQKNESKGWMVSQSLDVKIRDMQKISQIIEIAGQNGSTSISGPIFTVDDDSAYEAIARTKAIADAQKKVEAMKKSLGLEVGAVVGYNEWREDPTMSGWGEGKGGGGLMSMADTPTISSGTQELKLHVNISYLLEE
ncbi:SIMPL domain-containing protein [Candidatus Peregrinibacteria bacterium]|nr:SIMPL domain-containing protein [Candidatus Peregrinibacteria bacterium]